MKKDPIGVGGIDPSTDPELKKYSDGIKARAEASRKAKAPIGDLLAANEAYKPGKDRPMTIAQIAEAQRVATSQPDAAAPAALSPQTIEVLRATAEASREQLKKEPVVETTEKEDKPEPKKKLEEDIDRLDDFELERLMRSVQNDVINNDKERAAAEARASEIDFADGMANSEFTQWVDIIPGRLKVQFRTINSLEHQAIRLWIFNMAQKDPRIDRLASEIYGIATVVAAVAQINQTKQPAHLIGEGYDREFNETVFQKKYEIFRLMPMPLIHAISVHAGWFDMRVRKMFTADFVKNG